MLHDFSGYIMKGQLLSGSPGVLALEGAAARQTCRETVQLTRPCAGTPEDTAS